MHGLGAWNHCVQEQLEEKKYPLELTKTRGPGESIVLRKPTTSAEKFEVGSTSVSGAQNDFGKPSKSACDSSLGRVEQKVFSDFDRKMEDYKKLKLMEAVERYVACIFQSTL